MALQSRFDSARLLAMILALFCICPPSSAQTTHGLTPGHNLDWGGITYIAGTVYWPSGRQVDAKIGITLKSLTKGEFITTTTADGQFIFGGLPPGDYWIVLDQEKGFEPVNYYVEVTPPVPGTWSVTNKPAFHVVIRLRDKGVSAPKPAVVAVESVGIPKRAAELYNKALDLSAEKNNKGAIEQLKLAVEAYPPFLNAYNEMGVQYMRLNELEKADEALQAALKIKADAFEPILNRGIVLFRLKRFADAQILLRSAIGLKGESALAHFYLGRSLFAEQQYDEAVKELDLSVKIAGDEMKEAHRILAMIYIEKDDRPRAAAALETYLRLVPDAPDAAQLKEALGQLKGTQSPAVKPL